MLMTFRLFTRNSAPRCLAISNFSPQGYRCQQCLLICLTLFSPKVSRHMQDSDRSHDDAARRGASMMRAFRQPASLPLRSRRDNRCRGRRRHIFTFLRRAMSRALHAHLDYFARSPPRFHAHVAAAGRVFDFFQAVEGLLPTLQARARAHHAAISAGLGGRRRWAAFSPSRMPTMMCSSANTIGHARARSLAFLAAASPYRHRRYLLLAKMLPRARTLLEAARCSSML